ncbi:MAG: phytanoyl-CoA dioxygenase family protein [Acidiferrobacterales bacterium]|nr:phytanoyl-CoA dioxygenase family protein [Acidiferrobacterales bacterium]
MVKSANTNGMLTDGQVNTYWQQGIVAPLTAYDEHEALSMIPNFLALRERMAGWIESKQLVKTHLVSTWVNEVVRNPRILDAVESILGPNILMWGASFFAKEPGDTAHVGWHQDLRYWGLQPPNGVLSVWLALTDASEDNGAMQVIRASHENGFRSHDNSDDKNNMLLSGQNAQLTPQDEHNRLMVELRPGQFSMHHSMVLHGSGANSSDRSRVGLSIAYIAADVIQLRNGGHDSAMLVRGTDMFGNFELESGPEADFSRQAIENFRRSIAMPSGLARAEDRTDSIVNFNNIR